jgi:hypothetical protein
MAMRLWVLVAVLGAASGASAASGAPVPGPTVLDVVNEGQHWRLATARGAIHVWRPKGFERPGSATVVYVHGYFTDADTAWTKHRLAEQFEASGKDVTFIVPEAPVSSDEEVVWPELGDLLRAVEAGTGLSVPTGPLYVVAHSAAYRTVVGWLDYPPLRHIVLLDSLYGNEEDFLDWLDAARGHAGRRMTLVANLTTRWTEPFVKRLAYAHTPVKFPETVEDLGDARVEYYRAVLGHMELVTSGKLLPLVLQRLRAKSLKPYLPDRSPSPAAPASR